VKTARGAWQTESGCGVSGAFPWLTSSLPFEARLAFGASEGQRLCAGPGRGFLEGGGMADIIELILDDHRRIRLLRDELHAAAGQEDEPAAGDALASAWDSLAGLIELHLSGQGEIGLRLVPGIGAGTRAGSGPGAGPGSGPGAGEQMPHAAAAHDAIRVAAAEARSQPAGSGPWWQAVRTALSIWAEQLDHVERAVLPGFGRRTDGAQRDQLGRRWLTFRAARLLDLSPPAALDAPLCQFCHRPIPGSHRHILDARERAVFCACAACSELFHREIGPLPQLGAPRAPEPNKPSRHPA